MIYGGDIMEEYLGLLKYGDINELKKYKEDKFPKKFYKFYSLNNSKKLNKSKLRGLSQDKIWLSKYYVLNDPYEFNAIYIKDNPNDNYSKEKANIQMKKDIENYLISSLTENSYENMPMWAHYANNHSGFCLGFRVLNYDHIYPVLYDSERADCTKIINSKITEVQNIKNNNRCSNDIEKIKNDLNLMVQRKMKITRYENILFHSLCVKHQSWDCEKEYRLICNKSTAQNGIFIDTDEVGLKLEDIYIGRNMDYIYEKKLRKIAQIKKINIYKMYINNEIPEFKLSYKRIDI